jgi:hypothetical protein
MLRRWSPRLIVAVFLKWFFAASQVFGFVTTPGTIFEPARLLQDE